MSVSAQEGNPGRAFHLMARCIQSEAASGSSDVEAHLEVLFVPMTSHILTDECQPHRVMRHAAKFARCGASWGPYQDDRQFVRGKRNARSYAFQIRVIVGGAW